MTNSPTSRIKLALSGIAAVSLGACVNLVPDEVYPLGVVQPIDPALVASVDGPVEETIRTAKSGDLLLQQPVQNIAFLTLENEVEPDGNISLAVQERTLDLTAGDGFYAAVNLGQYPALVACSAGRPAVHIPRLNPGAQASGKICFELEAYDENVDLDSASLDQETYTTDRFFFVTDGVYGLSEAAGTYNKMTRWDQQLIYNVAPAARLVHKGDAEATEDAPALALRFVVTAEGASLEPVYTTTNQPLPMTKEKIAIDPTASFPRTVEYDGAQIELLALTDDVLAYRILAGFDTANSFVMDLPE